MGAPDFIFMKNVFRVGRCAALLLAVMVVTSESSLAQMETATLSGTVMDQSGAVLPDVQVQATNADTNVAFATTTNRAGLYVFPALKPGRYRVVVIKQGFKQISLTDVILNVQDVVSRNFNLQIGAASESITVSGEAVSLNSTDAAVSTVVDRNFAENLPMNGRSFQTLIELTPGITLTPVNDLDSGQFSVNGQRASSNYWMVDGVSANIGVNANLLPGSGFSGSVGAFTAQGGTNSLVSVDALQEFRIQTSTYAPEFGRSPGGQVSIVTRSGTNQFHGSVFDYFRNGALDANDWFADNNNLRKPQEHQNDFGGTLSGPIFKDKTFFFFSYEGLRLRLPQVTESFVPDADARQSAIPAMQPYLNAFPQPNGPEVTGISGTAQFNASYSNPSVLDAYSLRIDHRVSQKLAVFGRYNYSPSRSVLRGANGANALSDLNSIDLTTRTGTIGATLSISPKAVNDLRFNYSRVSSSSTLSLDRFGGAVPLTLLPFPKPFTGETGNLFFDIFNTGEFAVGKNAGTLQRQINIVDDFSVQSGEHSMKFGVDFRRLTPERNPAEYFQEPLFLDVSSASSGNMLEGIVSTFIKTPALFRNLGAFAQDTWRVIPRLTATYGVRWDVDFAPKTTGGPGIPAAVGFDLNNLSTLALAPSGTAPFATRYSNVAPRVGLAYQLSQNPEHGTVIRGGFGVFFDLATEQTGNIFQGSFPFGAQSFVFGTFPLDSTSAAPPVITAANLAPPFGTLAVFDPRIQLPYVLEWNVAFEQALGRYQTLSASYIGSAGRRLIQSAFITGPNSQIGNADLITNAGNSDYDAFQVQFQRRLSGGLQALASYTWSHSIDQGSAASFAHAANNVVPGENARTNRGPSDFDIRHGLSAGVTYEIPDLRKNRVVKMALGGWSVTSFVVGRSAAPVNVFDSSFFFLHNANTQVRPDIVAGIPLYLYGSQYPGGKIINNTPDQGGQGCIGPFCPPPTDSNGNPLRQGNLGRNALRGFGAAQWDFAVHRNFSVRENINLQFRAEIFNILNHPNFGPPLGAMIDPKFGFSTKMLGSSLDSGSGGGGLSSLYQVGGPRSIQLGIKLAF
jgi:hypothetical protein